MTPDLILLLDSFVIISAPFALSRMLRLNGIVPLVVTQIVLGIALGPSLFGRVAPDLYGVLLNPHALGGLSGAASIAVLFFGFITGLHIDTDSFRNRGAAFALIAGGSVIIPTVLGILGGWLIGVRHAAAVGDKGNIFVFSLGIGICLGVTALPVLAAILREMDLLGQKIAGVALGIAGASDALLWLFMTVLMTTVIGQRPGHGAALLPILFVPMYLLVMIVIVRPVLNRAVAKVLHDGTISEPALAAVVAVAIGSAVATQIIGLHYIFGAFFAGAIMPREWRQPILDRLQVMTTGVLMPFFFMMTGLRTRIDLSSDLFIETLFTTTILGTLGKIGGTMITGVLVGETWSSTLRLGTLLQTKGLTEIVVLTILLDNGIISNAAFSAMTLMALISTALVMPVTRVLLPRKSQAVLPSGNRQITEYGRPS